MLLFAFAKMMAVETGLQPPETRFWFLTKRRTLEHLVVLGPALICLRIASGMLATHQWELVRFGSLRPDFIIHLVMCSVLFLLFVGQTIIVGFYSRVLNMIAERHSPFVAGVSMGNPP